MAMGACQAVREHLQANPDFASYADLLVLGKQITKEIVRKQMQIFRSSGKCRQRIETCGVAQTCDLPVMPGGSIPEPALPAGRGEAAVLTDSTQIAEVIAEAVTTALKKLQR